MRNELEMNTTSHKCMALKAQVDPKQECRVFEQATFIFHPFAGLLLFTTGGNVEQSFYNDYYVSKPTLQRLGSCRTGLLVTFSRRSRITIPT